ncbi:sarcinarray family MAST domain-containing protein [Methanolobus vulcani]|nr:sarcinarray family MAST domain-containing protein [Methanolobus vulcani]
MNTKMIIVVLAIYFTLTPAITSATSQYISINVYYNDQLYPGASTPKPLVKIGEPFTVKFDVTCFNPGVLSVKLTELADGSFEVIEGPTSKIDQYTDDKLEINDTISYEWKLKATDEWAGGSMPLDFVYQLNDFETTKLLVQGEFTAAYVTISEEYYDGTEFTTDSTSNSEDESSSSSTPAFTALFTGFALVLAVIYKRK